MGRSVKYLLTRLVILLRLVLVLRNVSKVPAESDAVISICNSHTTQPLCVSVHPSAYITALWFTRDARVPTHLTAKKNVRENRRRYNTSHIFGSAETPFPRHRYSVHCIRIVFSQEVTPLLPLYIPPLCAA